MLTRITAIKRCGAHVIAMGEGREEIIARVTVEGWEWGDTPTAQPMRQHITTLLKSDQDTLILPENS